MPLAIFDLDNTLIAGDSDYLWGRYLIAQGVVDRDQYEELNDRFYRDYREGRLDIRAFLGFALAPLRDHPLPDLLLWRSRFLCEMIEPVVLPRALALVEHHRQRGDRLLIITATNEFVTGPIAERFGISDLIATVPERREDRFTGEVAGVPAFREGKVSRLEEWMTDTGYDLADSTFYSDSHNDLPLLERVTHPVAVDPDPRLRACAESRGWRILSLRDEV
ncbi:HAD family hydrolase [Thioalkalicoccus limnaeus]|uniref:HAD family hydrolase n=1 Tax=Thioalkalicoccus limnaeus TaxID=120681 RepID=A0ABV4BBJ3_9GAMM